MTMIDSLPTFLLAYIDPGVGSMLVQVIVAAIVTGGVFARRLLWTPIAWCAGKFRRKAPPTPEEG